MGSIKKVVEKKFVSLFLLIIISCLFSMTAFGQKFVRDTTIAVENGQTTVAVHLKYPKQKAIGTIVLLPGWKLPVTDWCTKTSFCTKALEKGYILIMPEMGKSIYSWQLYPETRADWQMYPTRRWFVDTLMVQLQKSYRILLPGQRNYILGLSTGGRGVALLCLDCPKIFKKGAALSGDYDQTRMPNDNLMKGYYGPMDKFPERWTGKDNVVYRFRELKIPLFLGHGLADKIVPCDQTIQFADSLQKYKPSLVKLHLDDHAGHDYNYWDSEVDAVLKFFEESKY